MTKRVQLHVRLPSHTAAAFRKLAQDRGETQSDLLAYLVGMAQGESQVSDKLDTIIQLLRQLRRQ